MAEDSVFFTVGWAGERSQHTVRAAGPVNSGHNTHVQYTCNVDIVSGLTTKMHMAVPSE